VEAPRSAERGAQSSSASTSGSTPGVTGFEVGDGVGVASPSPPSCVAPGVGAAVGGSGGRGVGPGVHATPLESAAQYPQLRPLQLLTVKHHSPLVSLSGLQQ